LNGCIASTNNSYVHVAIEGRITRAAVGNTFATHLLFTRDIEGVGTGAGTNDKSVTGDLSTTFKVEDFFIILIEIYFCNICNFNVEIEPFCVACHVFDEVKTSEAIRKTWVIVYPVREEYLSTGGAFFYHDMVKSGSCCV